MEQNNGPHNQTPKRRKRNRGGQPGNRNAMKHGYYSSYLTPEERRRLRKAQGAEGLKHEIDFLRVKMGTMASNPNVTLGEFAAAASAVARLMSVDHRISMARGEDEKLEESIENVLNTIGRTMGMGEYRDAARDGEG